MLLFTNSKKVPLKKMKSLIISSICGIQSFYEQRSDLLATCIIK